MHLEMVKKRYGKWNKRRNGCEVGCTMRRAYQVRFWNVIFWASIPKLFFAHLRIKHIGLITEFHLMKNDKTNIRGQNTKYMKKREDCKHDQAKKALKQIEKRRFEHWHSSTLRMRTFLVSSSCPTDHSWKSSGIRSWPRFQSQLLALEMHENSGEMYGSHLFWWNRAYKRKIVLILDKSNKRYAQISNSFISGNTKRKDFR